MVNKKPEVINIYMTYIIPRLFKLISHDYLQQMWTFSVDLETRPRVIDLIHFLKRESFAHQLHSSYQNLCLTSIIYILSLIFLLQKIN